ncbi:MAG: Bro-N domain-containing protein [Pseudomonadota bacterium]
MNNKDKIKLFKDQKIRTHWDDEQEKWFFSIVDVIEVLTDSPRARKYWNALKTKLNDEGSELSQNMGQLKMQSADGKFYKTDVADTQQLLRLIQSIPSPKAEPFKQWLAKVGAERIDEIDDPELAFDRAMKSYLAKGYSKEWINQRLKSIEVRKDLTDEWQERGMKEGLEYAILTNEITQAWADKSVKDYKKLKGLKKENLRDNMSNLELVLNMLAEASTTEISKEQKPEGLTENKSVARKGGIVAKKARVEIEKQTGKPVVTDQSAKKQLGDSNND